MLEQSSCLQVLKHRTSLIKHQSTCKKRPGPQDKPVCGSCGHKFTRKDTLTRHKKKCQGFKKDLQCHVCCKIFDRKRNLERHIQTHQSIGHQCEFCSATFKRLDHFNNHQKNNCNPDKQQEVDWNMLSFESRTPDDLSSFSMAFENVTETSPQLNI
jgi:hypothetical protein